MENSYLDLSIVFEWADPSLFVFFRQNSSFVWFEFTFFVVFPFCAARWRAWWKLNLIMSSEANARNKIKKRGMLLWGWNCTEREREKEKERLWKRERRGTQIEVTRTQACTIKVWVVSKGASHPYKGAPTHQLTVAHKKGTTPPSWIDSIHTHTHFLSFFLSSSLSLSCIHTRTHSVFLFRFLSPWYDAYTLTLCHQRQAHVTHHMHIYIEHERLFLSLSLSGEIVCMCTTRPPIYAAPYYTFSLFLSWEVACMFTRHHLSLSLSLSLSLQIQESASTQRLQSVFELRLRELVHRHLPSSTSTPTSTSTSLPVLTFAGFFSNKVFSSCSIKTKCLCLN